MVSLLRKILDQGLFSMDLGEGRLFPLGSNCVAIERENGTAFLADNLGRKKEYGSLAEALETKITRRKYLLGEL